MCQIKFNGVKNKKIPVLNFCRNAEVLPVEYAKLILLGTYPNGKRDAQRHPTRAGFDGNKQQPSESYDTVTKCTNLPFTPNIARTYRQRFDRDILTDHSSHSAAQSMDTSKSHQQFPPPPSHGTSREQLVRPNDQRTVVDRLDLHSTSAIESPVSSFSSQLEHSPLFREIDTILSNIPREVFDLNNADVVKYANYETDEDLLAKIVAAESGLKYLRSQMAAIEKSTGIPAPECFRQVVIDGQGSQMLGISAVVRERTGEYQQASISPPTRQTVDAQSAPQKQHDTTDSGSAAPLPQATGNVTPKKHTPPSQIPRFAQPTEATIRRAGETLRQHKSPEKSKLCHESKVETNSNCDRTPTPKRTGLPTAWLMKDELDNDPNVSEKTESWKASNGTMDAQTSPRRGTNYMSSTQATLRRKATSKKPLSTPNVVSTAASLQHAAYGKAIDHINAMAKKKNSFSYAQAVTNTTIVPRKENEEIFPPIMQKLDQQGLLKDDLDKLDGSAARQWISTSSHSGSYADAVRKPYSREPLGSRAQTSSDIGKAIAHRASRSSGAHSEASSKIDSVVEGRGSYGSKDERQTLPGISNLDGQYDSICASPDHIAGEALGRPEEAEAVDNDQESSSSDPVDSNGRLHQTSSFTFNAAAATFEPGSDRVGMLSSPRASASQESSSYSDDIFHSASDRRYRALSLERQTDAKPRHILNTEYADPLKWQKDILLSQLGSDSPSIELDPTIHLQATPSTYVSSSTQSPVEHVDTSVIPRYGWTVSTRNQYGPTWSGGNGREMKCAWYGPDVERARYGTYAYQNRNTGMSAIVQDSSNIPRRDSPPIWLSKWLAVQDLQLAIDKGYPKVPCKHFGSDLPDKFNEHTARRGPQHKKSPWNR